MPLPNFLRQIRQHSLFVFLSMSLFLRIILILIGLAIDATSRVAYTDIDYRVVSDAASLIANGKSPYLRSTYRYTPLLAILVLPGQLFNLPSFGKFVFVSFDIIAALLIRLLLRNHQRRHRYLAMGVWLYNPWTLTISSRGNCESVMATLVLLVLLLLKRRTFIWAGVTFGLAIHFKIYPVIYSLSIWLSLGQSMLASENRNQKLSFADVFTPTAARIKFVATSLLTLITLSLLFFWAYGWQFIEETYFYHVTRQDVRHNFSPAFYPMYLLTSSETGWLSTLTGMVSTVTQMVTVFFLSVTLYRHQAFAWFLQTLAFVAFNKVMTSQYFIWFITFLPVAFLATPLSMDMMECAGLLALWLLMQGFWLLQAYCLEFESANFWDGIWIFSLILCITHVTIILYFLRAHRKMKNCVKRNKY